MEVLDQQEIPREGRTLDSVINEGYTFELGNYLNAAFNMFGKDAGNFIGYCLVSFIINFVIGLIPFIGAIAGIFIAPALAAGYYFYLKAGSGELAGQRSFSNFFDGFKTPYWMQLVLANLIIAIFVIIAAVIVAIPLFMGVGLGFIQDLASAGQMNDPDKIQEVAALIFGSKLIFSVIFLFLAIALVMVLWIFTPQFIVFHNLSFWDAMEASRKVVMKNYLKVLLFLIVLGVLVVLGAILCLVGLLVAMPVFYLALYAAFYHIFSNESRLTMS
jgi:uncharacterized membrane protein